MTRQSRSPNPPAYLTLLGILLLGFQLSACQAPALDLTKNQISPTVPATAVAAATATPLATPFINQPPFDAWVNPAFPPAVKEQIAANPSLVLTAIRENATVVLSDQPADLAGYWTYLAVVPFHSLQREISSADLITLWKSGITDQSPYSALFITPETRDSLTLLWGDPGGEGLSELESQDFRDLAWPVPNAIAIIPFEDIDPTWTILAVDGMHPLDPGYQANLYPLNFPLYISSTEISTASLSEGLDLANYDPAKLTSVAMTGVTALVRDTAAIMEEKGITYPATDVGEILRSADITHISNEVPFAEDCPPPDSNQPSLYFCSSDSYIELLAEVGTDIVELSGDHFGDWGPEAMLHSLDLYRAQGWLFYGGGENLQAGLEPVFIEHNQNRIAFIGCNGKAHAKYATASEVNPGASRCDFEYMLSEISLLDNQSYLVIATMQHEEVDSFSPIAIQLHDFRNLADAGAVIVSGSQAHHPQSFEFTGSSFIHYGLGNLFFDQWYLSQYNPSIHINKDKGFIDLHYFYDGAHISTRLVGIQFIDNARPRLMSPEENALFLADIYKWSIWNKQPLPGYYW